MFSGLLDQSDTQSALFFKTSNSFSPSTASSSDWKYTLESLVTVNWLLLMVLNWEQQQQQ